MGWSFCCHFCVVGESFHSRFLLIKFSSWAASTKHKTYINSQTAQTHIIILILIIVADILLRASLNTNIISEHFYSHSWLIPFPFSLKKKKHSTKKKPLSRTARNHIIGPAFLIQHRIRPMSVFSPTRNHVHRRQGHSLAAAAAT